MYRVAKGLLPAMNSNRILHGDLNDQLPNRDSFRRSTSRVAEKMISLLRNFANRCLRSLERALDVSMRRPQKAPQVHMSDEVGFYETSLQACQCGETKLRTSTLGIGALPSRQYRKSAARPPLPSDIRSVLGRTYRPPTSMT
jgi:hypothetical protein